MSDVSIIGKSGVKTDIHFEDGSMAVKRSQYIGNMVDEFRHLSENQNRRAQGRIAARVPLQLYWKWREEWERGHSDKWEWKTFFAMKINNPDYKFLRNSKL